MIRSLDHTNHKDLKRTYQADLTWLVRPLSWSRSSKTSPPISSLRSKQLTGLKYWLVGYWFAGLIVLPCISLTPMIWARNILAFVQTYNLSFKCFNFSHLWLELDIFWYFSATFWCFFLIILWGPLIKSCFSDHVYYLTKWSHTTPKGSRNRIKSISANCLHNPHSELLLQVAMFIS